MEYNPGDCIYWWPGNTDYPSVIELIQPVENGWRVNYLSEPEAEDWDIPYAEMGETKLFDVNIL